MSENVVQFVRDGETPSVDEATRNESSAESVSVCNPDTFFYPTPALEKLTEALVRSVNDKGFLTVVQGDQGSGKTTLMQQFLGQIQPEWALCLIQVHHVIGEKHILEQLNNHFFPYNDYGVEVLADRLLLIDAPCWPVIVVDDADKLSSFALNVLLSLKSKIEEQGGRFGLVLFALPSIQTVLSSPSLLRHDEIVRVIDMPSLLEQQTMAYIDQLCEAGALISPLRLSSGHAVSLTQGQKRAIFRRSGGRPGRINGMVVDAVQRRRWGGTSSPRFVLLHQRLMQPRLWTTAAVLVLLVYAGSGWLMPEVGDHASVASAVEFSRQSTQQQESVKSGQRVSIVAVNKEALTSQVVERPSASQLSAVTVRVKSDQPTVAAVPVKLITGLLQTLPPAVAEAVLERVVLNEPMDGQAWLLAQNEGDYTVQLAASAYEDAISRFMDKQSATDGLRYVHIVRRGKDWYVSLFGSYSTFAQAQQAIADLPVLLRKNAPWIRRISALQAMLPVSGGAAAVVVPTVEPAAITALPLSSVSVTSPAVLSNTADRVANDDIAPAVISSARAATAAANPSQSE